jgi:hypothetical protein
MHEGPWLDRLFPVTLPGGRVCSVTGFSVLPAYSGILEGGADEASNARQRVWAMSLARERFGKPLHIVEPTITPIRPGRMRLPWMVCMARLVSRPLALEFGWSSLAILWWQDGFDAPLPLEIERAASGVEWEREARDFDLP